MMPSPKLRQLQDEAAVLAKEIADLRSLADSAKDESDAKDIEARLADAMGRSDICTAAVKREQEIDARLASLRAVNSDSDPRSAIESGKEEKTEAVAELRSGVRLFSSARAAHAVGSYLKALYTGEHRAMGESSTAYDNLGAEFVVKELFGAIVNRLQYSSVALQLATVIRPSGQKIDFPKVGDATASIVAEGVATTDQDIATSVANLTMYEVRGSVAVSRSLIEDSPIDVAGLVAERFALAYAQRFDALWLAGQASNPTIAGLAGAVAAGNTITVAANASTTLANLADVVGKVDEAVMGTSSWVCSRAGWVDLMKIWSAQQTTLTVGGGRVVPTIFGAPVYLVKGLPASTLALYGDFAMSTAVGVKASGLEIEAGREILMRNRQVLYVANTRFGVANHAPEFVARLAKA
jgi:HK97 family phage major capsid protein